MFNSNKILVLAPHTDDGELGCGGTIARLADEGKEVFYVAFSTCGVSLPAGMPPDTLEKEVKEATKVLGVYSDNLFILDYANRVFKERRQDILDDLIKLRQKINPDIVFLPCSTDIHQDHQVVFEEGVRAFKHTTILGYEMPWNNMSLHTTNFIKLQDKYMDIKVEALRKYHSQSERSYFNENFIRSLATTRGVQVGCKYAEAFEVVRWIWN